MSTATTIPDLFVEAEAAQQDAAASAQKARDLLDKISELAANQRDQFSVMNGASSPPSGTDIVDQPTTRRRKTKKAATGRGRANNANNGGMALRPAILKILGTRSMWKEHLSELPKAAKGLTAGEIRTVIHATGLWSSNSKTADNQIYTACSGLVNSGEIKRDKDRRYRVA
jgi:hypothetical protein